MKEQKFKIVSVWECEKPELKKMRFKKEFRPYPYFIVYDFEALHKKMDEPQTEELTITSRHVPVSVAINDNLTNEPVFIRLRRKQNRSWVQVVLGFMPAVSLALRLLRLTDF